MVEAVVELEELLDAHPGDPDALWLVGAASLEQHDLLTAFEVYRELCDIDGGMAALMQRALCAMELCELEDAIEAGTKVLDVVADHAEAHYVVGLSHQFLGHTAEAETHLDAAFRFNPMAFPYPLPMETADWRLLLNEAFSALSPGAKSFYRNLPVHLDDAPDLEVLRATVPPTSPRVVLLLEGPPPHERSELTPPEGVRLFRRNIARHDTRDTALSVLVHALEQEAMDWLPPAAGTPS